MWPTATCAASKTQQGRGQLCPSEAWTLGQHMLVSAPYGSFRSRQNTSGEQEIAQMLRSAASVLLRQAEPASSQLQVRE